MVSCISQSFDEIMPLFLSHYCIPVIWWVYDIDTTIGVMLNFFSPIRVIMCKHLFCNELWLTIFLVITHCLLCLWCGPCICYKSLLLFILGLAQQMIPKHVCSTQYQFTLFKNIHRFMSFCKCPFNMSTKLVFYNYPIQC